MGLRTRIRGAMEDKGAAEAQGTRADPKRRSAWPEERRVVWGTNASGKGKNLHPKCPIRFIALRGATPLVILRTTTINAGGALRH
jgi:hypothetical protein